MKLNFRQTLTYTAHLFKALTKSRFQALEPMLKTHIPVDGVVLDVGANAGYFTRIFSKMAANGRVYSFEPGSYARSILNKVVTLRGLSNVTVLPFGLGDKPSSQELHLPLKDSGSLGYGLAHIGDDKQVDHRDTVSENIDIRTLDSFIAEQNIDRVDFIKIDIEGWEMRALEGGRTTISKHRPVLMLEMVDRFLGRAGDSSQKLWDYLKSYGYDLYRFDENGRIDQLEAPVAEGDILCVPHRAS